jgi:hypothetical protein
MQRRTFDILVSFTGVILAAILTVAGGLALWGHNYINHEVHAQLAAQKIYFPPANSPAIAAPEFKAMHQYAGQELTTGAQAEVYADHFIADHLTAIGGGKTYAQLSTQAMAQPNNAKLAATVQKMFQGETLRGLLLNAYAFDKMGVLAGYAALAAFIGAGVLLLLSVVGLAHSQKVAPAEALLAPSFATVTA